MAFTLSNVSTLGIFFPSNSVIVMEHLCFTPALPQSSVIVGNCLDEGSPLAPGQWPRREYSQFTGHFRVRDIKTEISMPMTQPVGGTPSRSLGARSWILKLPQRCACLWWMPNCCRGRIQEGGLIQPPCCCHFPKLP